MNALILVAGLPGSGKTTVARAFAQSTGAVHFNSEALRKTLGMMGQYTAADKARVYDALLALTEAALLRGETVVIDSTFYKEANFHFLDFNTLAMRQHLYEKELHLNNRPPPDADHLMYSRKSS